MPENLKLPVAGSLTNVEPNHIFLSIFFTDNIMFSVSRPRCVDVVERRKAVTLMMHDNTTVQWSLVGG